MPRSGSVKVSGSVNTLHPARDGDFFVGLRLLSRPGPAGPGAGLLRASERGMEPACTDRGVPCVPLAPWLAAGSSGCPHQAGGGPLSGGFSSSESRVSPCSGWPTAGLCSRWHFLGASSLPGVTRKHVCSSGSRAGPISARCPMSILHGEAAARCSGAGTESQSHAAFSVFLATSVRKGEQVLQLDLRRPGTRAARFSC